VTEQALVLEVNYIYSIGLVSYIFRPAIEIQSYGVLLGDCVDNLLLGEYPSESPIGDFLGDLAGLGGGRDYSMTQNFLNSLYEGDSTNPVLVTGSGHLSAMREEFEKEGDFEYKRIFLDD